jgi:hypothetical protein
MFECGYVLLEADDIALSSIKDLLYLRDIRTSEFSYAEINVLLTHFCVN